jgi:NAD+ kinase
LIKRVGVVSRLDDRKALEIAANLFRFVCGKRLVGIPEEEFARLKQLPGGKPLSEMRADLIVTVGGDGTVLKTSMLIPEADTPILAVNMGRRGYLTEVPPERAKEAINECLKGRARLEEHMKLTVFHDDGSSVDGLNEALFVPTLPHKMITLNIEVGGHNLVECRADGLVVATPTGSTAHAFSAGGPVLDPSLEAFVLVFICPVDPVHPVVVPARKEVAVRLSNEDSRASVIVDGRHRRDIAPGKPVLIGRSKRKAVFVRFDRPRTRRTLVRFPAVEIGRSESAGS